MRKLIALWAFFACSLACATVAPVTSKVKPVIDCTLPEIKAQIPAIITEVVTDLWSKSYDQLLNTLALRMRDDVVYCAVLSTTIQGPGFAEKDPLSFQHAQDYLRSHGQ